MSAVSLTIFLEASGEPAGQVRGFVVEEETGLAISQAMVMIFRPGAAKAWSQWTTDVGDDLHLDGSFGGYLPVGDMY